MTPLLLASAFPEYPSLLETARFQLVGIVIVFIALGLIWVAMSVSGMIFRRLPIVVKEKGRDASPKETPKAAVSGTGDGAASPEIVAVIAAAVHVAVQQPHRILSIQVTGEHGDHPVLQPWSVEGRRQIFLSHRIR